MFRKKNDYSKIVLFLHRLQLKNRDRNCIFNNFCRVR